MSQLEIDKKRSSHLRFPNPLADLSRAVGHHFRGLQERFGQIHVDRHTASDTQDHQPGDSQSSLLSASARLPVTKEQLGRSTWTLLHTVAAHYPESPTKQERQRVKSLIESLAQTYPCADCAQHFQALLRKKPPKVGSHDELELWMCEVHNAVNARLEKPQFDCRRTALRWGNADCDIEGACAIRPMQPKTRP